MSGFICSLPRYEYKGFCFEYNGFIGPIKLNKNGEESKRSGLTFYTAFDDWYSLPKTEREKYRVGGGCERF